MALSEDSPILPITDWTVSSAFFSEKYLGLLPQRAKAYDDSNAFDHAWALKRRLLIAASMNDRDTRSEQITELETN